MSAPEVVVEFRNVDKSFGSARALESINLKVLSGEMLGLVGANGAGKSTLVKLLAGYHAPTSGSILVHGSALPPSYGPTMSHELGMYFVHQDAPLIDNLSVLENLAWLAGGYARNAVGGIRWKEQRRRSAEALAAFAHAPGLDEPAGNLSPAERTVVVLAGLLWAAKSTSPLLVLDEPTASLPPSEVTGILETLRHAAQNGAAVIFISHRLDEVGSSCDRAAVLRDGRLVSISEGRVDARQLVQDMFGAEREVPAALAALPGEDGAGDARLSVQHLSGRRVVDVTLSIARGEIVGVGGLQGCGRSEFGRLVAGIDRPTNGQIVVDGCRREFHNVRDAQRAGVAYVPADRLGQAVITDMVIRDNIMLRHGRWTNAFWTSVAAERAIVDSMIARFRVRPCRSDLPIGALSGGNQQKCVLAKWIEPNPAILVLDEPTRGVDVAAKAEIHQLLRDTARRGTAILVLSSEAEELAAVCSSVAVLKHGRLAARLWGRDVSERRIVDVAC